MSFSFSTLGIPLIINRLGVLYVCNELAKVSNFGIPLTVSELGVLHA